VKILIYESNILAVGVLTETADAITSSDAIYPKHVISGWQIVEATLPADYAPGKYSFNAGVFSPIPFSATPEEHKAKAIEVREARNLLIAKCDWTQCADVSAVVKAEWAPYRAALRDVPQQAGFPFSVIWPT
jgi:hypothetical protein